MANGHIISISRPAKVFIDTGRLAIKFYDGAESAFIALDDVSVLILEDRTITVTQQLIAEIAEHGGVVIFINDKHLPTSIALPQYTNYFGARRPRQQAAYIGTPQIGKWWRQIVTAKIRGQAKTIKVVNAQAAEKLLSMSLRVKDADAEHMEAIAARFYWEEFFMALGLPSLIRTKQASADAVNISLNYAYAIIRAIIARSMACAGLCLNFGVGHCRADNPFNLVEDFIEPFRYIADAIVMDIFLNNKKASFSVELKNKILSDILRTDIELDGKMYRILQAVDFSVNSFCVSLEDTRRKLILPNQAASSGKKTIFSSKDYIRFSEQM